MMTPPLFSCGFQAFPSNRSSASWRMHPLAEPEIGLMGYHITNSSNQNTLQSHSLPYVSKILGSLLQKHVVNGHKNV